MEIGLPERNTNSRDIFHNEEGFSTVGMVLALLITLSLVFTAAQVYQVNSASADVQNVADMAALASENEVAEFYILVRICDAIVLSLSLTGLVVLGVGVVVLCVPFIGTLGEGLIQAGKNVLNIRNTFAEKAASALDSIQKALPFLCAARAVAVVSASSGGSLQSTYQGFAIVVPLQGEAITFDAIDGLDDLENMIDEKKDAIKQAAEEAEKAAHEANKYKKIAFEHDCGYSPNYCMQERAERLAQLSPRENPMYQSVETWSFSVAMKRAQSYYPQRLAQEAPTDSSTKEQVQSVLRKRFYAYAVKEIAKGYVKEDETSFDAHFPRLPKNTSEMKQTELYVEAAYPITNSSSKQTIHAWEGCPGAVSQGVVSYGSLAQSDDSGFITCSYCEFSSASLGKVAAASTSIENGFEYHYNKVADAAEQYQKARENYDPQAKIVDEATKDIFENLVGLIEKVASQRIDAKPPGRFGSIAFVASLDATPVSNNFATTFIKGDQVLGTRAAISAATLVKEPGDEGRTIISSFLDGFSERFDSGAIEGATHVLKAWSSLLQAYSQGQTSLTTSLEEMLNGIPLMSESGLGTKAANSLSKLIESVGLQPVDVSAPKPVLVNSIHVLRADNSQFATHMLAVKEASLAYENMSGADIFSTALSSVETSVFKSIDWENGEITIASIELFGDGGPSIPLTFTLPQAIKSQADGMLDAAYNSLRGIVGESIGGKQWS